MISNKIINYEDYIGPNSKLLDIEFNIPQQLNNGKYLASVKTKMLLNLPELEIYNKIKLDDDDNDYFKNRLWTNTLVYKL